MTYANDIIGTYTIRLSTCGVIYHFGPPAEAKMSGTAWPFGNSCLGTWSEGQQMETPAPAPFCVY